MDYDYLKYKKILIVDDEADLREMVTSILEQDGFKTIKTAGTVAEALKICRDWEPDLAILDVMCRSEIIKSFQQKLTAAIRTPASA